MAAQFPDGDVSTGAWTPTPVWDEINDLSDTDFVTSKTLSTPDQFVVHIEDFDDPRTDVGFWMLIRATKDSTGGQVLTIDWVLKQGASTVKSDSWELTDSASFNWRIVVLSQAEAALITDFTDLRFDVTASGSFDLPRKKAKVSALYMTSPSPVVTKMINGTIYDATIY